MTPTETILFALFLVILAAGIWYGAGAITKRSDDRSRQ